MKLNEMLLASVRMPDATVVASAVAFEMLTTGVPVTVSPVAVAVVQSVPPVLLQTMFPVPNAIVLTFEFEELNAPHVKL